MKQVNRFELDTLMRHGYRIYHIDSELTPSMFSRIASILRNRCGLDIHYEHDIQLILIKNKKPEHIEQTKSII